MIEAVGWRHIGAFFAKCSELLAPDGAMLLQAITIDDRAYEVEKASRSFINTHIFPGGCLPSLEMIARNVARRTDMQMVALEDLTPHYVETLRRWQRNFAAHAQRARRARVRRALPAPVDALPHLLRGRIRGAAHLRHPAHAGQAARVPAGMCRFDPGARFTQERTTGLEGKRSWPSEASARRMASG